VIINDPDSMETGDDELSKLPGIIFEYPQLYPEKGIEYCGDADDYLYAIETFEASVDTKADLIEADLEKEDTEALALNFHSLKSTSGAIGADKLSEKAKVLEAAAKAKDFTILHNETPGLLSEYRSLKTILHNVLEQAQKEKQNAILSGKKVLLAEDMAIDAQIVKQVLKLKDIEADLASNGEEVLQIFCEKDEGTYDAIIMDIRMPKMDGLEAAKKIRESNRRDAKSIPIIALTGNSFDGDVQLSLDAGMNTHLTKPVEPDALFAALSKYMAKN